MNPKEQYKRNQALLRQIKSAYLSGIEKEIEGGAQVERVADEALQKIAFDFVADYKEAHPAILKLLLDNGADLFGRVTMHYMDVGDREEEIAKFIVQSGKSELIDVVYGYYPDFEIVPYLNAINEEKAKDEMNNSEIPIGEFPFESGKSIPKEEILSLLDDDILWSDEWLERFKSFTGPAQTHRAVLNVLVEEILLHPVAFELDDWAEAAKCIIDCMVDYDAFAAKLYGISLEEYQAYDGDDEGGAGDLYSDENYSLTRLIVKLLSNPDTFSRNEDDWYEVFEYYGKTFAERAPFDTSQDDAMTELMKVPFLQGSSFGDNVKSCCKKYFRFAKC